MPSPARAARSAQSTPGFRVLARAGYAANGIVHVLLGVLVLVAAFGGSSESDQSGAFRAIADAPWGFAALWILAIALAALGAWHVIEALLPRGRSGTERLGRVASEAGQGIAFLALGVIAVTIALGARPRGEENAEAVSGGVLAMPGGPFLLGLAGLVVGGIGVGFVVIGVRGGFRKKIRVPAGAWGASVTALGVAGYVAKGVALGIVGVLLVVAAVRVDPSAAGGLDGAVKALLSAPAGPALATLVGIGFVAYGVFTMLRSRYALLES